MCERDSVITDAPSTPRSSAACDAAARTKGGRPARSASPSSRSWNDDSSARTFWPKRVVSSARRCITSAWRRCSVGASLAPARTKSRWKRSSRRRCSPLETEAVASDEERIDADEECGVVVDAAVVRSQDRRHFALDGLQRGRGLARREVVEQRADAAEEAAGAVERGDRVLEGRRRRPLRRSPRCRRGAARIASLERRREVLGPHRLEGRQSERTGPGCEQRVASFLAALDVGEVAVVVAAVAAGRRVAVLRSPGCPRRPCCRWHAFAW